MVVGVGRSESQSAIILKLAATVVVHAANGSFESTPEAESAAQFVRLHHVHPAVVPSWFCQRHAACYTIHQTMPHLQLKRLHTIQLEPDF